MLKKNAARLLILLFLVLVTAALAYRHRARRFLNAEAASAGAAADRYALASLPPNVRAALQRIHFTDVADSAGLHYRWEIPGKRPLNILQTIGNGCAFLDYNGDGNLDILLIGSPPALYRGDGKGHFADVTRETGLDACQGHFLGCAVADYDNDGFEDIYISGYHTGLLLHNEAGRRFRDVTGQAGLKPQPWGTSCAWADIDGTGHLSLYVCNYVEFGPDTKPQLCSVMVGNRAVPLACDPQTYPGLRGVLYQAMGNGRFADATKTRGLDQSAGNGLGAAFADVDGSGHAGLAVANDEKPGDLFQNTGKGRWRNIGTLSGTAFDSNGAAHGGMGMDWGDADNDGRQDLLVCTFEGQVKNLYHNQGDGLFQDVSAATGLNHYLRHAVSFGCKFLDVDNDGWLDILIANGHTYDNVADVLPLRRYQQPTQLLYNIEGTRFTEISRSAGLDRLLPIVGRGLAAGDYDNDGRVDALVVDSEGRPQLLHNESVSGGHWLLLKLIGTKSNRDGYGAVVTIESGGRTQTRVCHADGSYLSSSDARVHVGLGNAATATITVRWPSGGSVIYRNVAADQLLHLREGHDSPL